MAQIPIDNYKRPVHFQGYKSVCLLGVGINTLTVDQVIDYITHTVSRGGKAIIAYINVHAINLAQDVNWFKEFLNLADLTYCDGFGIKWGARFLGSEIPERFTPPDWFPRLVQICAREGLSLYFLGARPGIGDQAASQLLKTYPELNIVGVQHGYFDKTHHQPENDAVIRKINQCKPDILVIGFGMPIQERWIRENWEHIDSKVVLTVGALFDYLAGDIHRAPQWMTDRGFEWLGRLIYEPGRLWRRYLLGNPRFVFNIIKERIRRISFDR